jgi:2'-5' RNA ligase
LPSLEAAAGAVIARGFVLRLDRLAYWPRNGIVWFGNDRPPVELLELVGSLNSELAGRRFPVERRPFAVHVTLVRKARCDGRLGEAQPLTWPVGDFVLVESNLGPEGAHYSLLRRWPLIASP